LGCTMVMPCYTIVVQCCIVVVWHCMELGLD
jgi:hypothetical protein